MDLSRFSRVPSNSPNSVIADMLPTGDVEQSFYAEVVMSKPSAHVHCMDEESKYTPATSDLMPLEAHPDLRTSDGPEDLKRWAQYHPESWTPEDAILWMYHCIQLRHLSAYTASVENFRHVTGQQLCAMSRDEFISREPRQGAHLYDCLQNLLDKCGGQFQPPTPEEYQPDLRCSPSLLPSALPPITCMTPEPLLVLGSDPILGHSRVKAEFYSSEDDSGSPSIEDYDYNPNDTFADVLPPAERPNSTGSDADRWYSDYPESDGASTLSAHPSFSDDMTSLNNDIYDWTRQEEAEDVSRLLVGVEIKTEPEWDDEEAMVAPKVKRRAGGAAKKPRSVSKPKPKSGRRPRNGHGSRGNHLWEFIRDLLHSQLCPKVIKWEEHEQGVFRIVRSDEVARLWGSKKNNPRMTYEKLSRALRFCRTQGFFDDVPRTGKFPKKLCFKFGPRAEEWK